MLEDNLSNVSCGVAKPKTFLGLVLRRFSTLRMSSEVRVVKLCDFGRSLEVFIGIKKCIALLHPDFIKLLESFKL